MEIVACTDHGFIMPTGVMIQSVCVNNIDSHVSFHIIGDESITEKDKEDLKSVVNKIANKDIFFHIVDGNKFGDLPALDNTYVTKATYYRLELARLLPNSVDKVLYLDGDIIVRKSLDDLWNLDISKYALAAVPDQSEAIFEEENYLKVEHWHGYFNAGVMLVNLKYWKERNLRKDYYNFIQNYPDRIRLRDQDVLNYVLNEKKLLIPIRYNFTGGWLLKSRKIDTEKYKDQIDDAIKDPVIVHYTPGEKPWTTYCRQPYKALFLKYKSQTIWKGTPLIENRPLKLRISKFFSGILRKFKLMPEIPYGKEYIPGLKQLE